MSYCDLTRYKVIFNDKVLRALTLMEARFPSDKWPGPDNPAPKPENITVLVIIANGMLEALTGRAEDFQFIPILS